MRGNVDSLMKLIAALDKAGLELIGEGATSHGGGRGVRFKAATGRRAGELGTEARHRPGDGRVRGGTKMPLAAALWSVAALLSIALLAVPVCRSRAAGPAIYAACLGGKPHHRVSHCPSVDRLGGSAGDLLSYRSGCLGSARIFASTHLLRCFWPLSTSVPRSPAYSRSAMAGMNDPRQRVLPFLSGIPGRHESRRPGRRRLHISCLLGVHVAVVLGTGDGPPSRVPTTAAPATFTS